MTLTDAQADALIEAVRAAARDEIMPRFRNLDASDIDTKTGPQDLVTIADREAERAITEAARAILPGALIVGEEAAADDPSLTGKLADAETAVIIDPVDGTWNFARGLAVFGVILAVRMQGETVFGLLYDPVLDDWVMGRKGQGAWYCRPGAAPLRLAGPKPKPKAESILLTPLDVYPAADQPAIAARFPAYGQANSLRCSCHEYRLFAQGHVDAIVSPDAKPWDHAAGVLIAQECGHVVRDGGVPGYDPAAARLPLVVHVAGGSFAEW